MISSRNTDDTNRRISQLLGEIDMVAVDSSTSLYWPDINRLYALLKQVYKIILCVLEPIEVEKIDYWREKFDQLNFIIIQRRADNNLQEEERAASPLECLMLVAYAEKIFTLLYCYLQKREYLFTTKDINVNMLEFKNHIDFIQKWTKLT